MHLCVKQLQTGPKHAASRQGHYDRSSPSLYASSFRYVFDIHSRAFSEFFINFFKEFSSSYFLDFCRWIFSLSSLDFLSASSVFQEGEEVNADVGI